MSMYIGYIIIQLKSKTMKNLTLIVWAVMAVLFSLTSCNRDEHPDFSANDKNTLTLKFENIVEGVGPLVLNSTVLTSASGQKHKFKTLKYIISDVVLVKSDGTEYAYHFKNPDKGAYIVDQSESTATHNFDMSEIPAGDYTQVKFGIGISPEAFTLGQNGQAQFWDKAKASGMSWSWASGYKFVNFEGVYGENLDKNFQTHIGNIGNPSVSNTPNVYKVVTLNLPQTAKVRKNIAPKIHIMASVNKFLSGTNSVVLDDANAVAMHPSKNIVLQTSENISKMFGVDHVHND